MIFRIGIVALLLLVSVTPGISAEEALKEPENKGAQKEGLSEKAGKADFMASLWSKIVKTGKKRSASVPTSVAGLRGAEQEKEKELVPYWKGKEKDKDAAAMSDIEDLINKNEFVGAIEALKSFGPSYPDSPLKPASVLMLAYCYTQTGKQGDARLAFENFLKDYPNHELALDAKAGIEFIKNEGTK